MEKSTHKLLEIMWCPLTFDLLGGVHHCSNYVEAYEYKKLDRVEHGAYEYHFERIHPLKMRTECHLDGW